MNLFSLIKMNVEKLKMNIKVLGLQLPSAFFSLGLIFSHSPFSLAREGEVLPAD